MPPLPWIIAGATLALAMAGTAGMYGGYEIANARHAQAQQDLKDAQIEALEGKNALILAETRRGNRIADEFLSALGNIRVENKTFNNEVRRETVKEIYTDCVVPDTGVELLNRHIETGNLRLIGRTRK